MKEKKTLLTWLSTIALTCSIIGIICRVLFYPINSRFEKIENFAGLIHEKVSSHYNKHKTYDNIVITIDIRLQQILDQLDDFKDELKKCREKDDELREKIYQYLSQ